MSSVRFVSAGTGKFLPLLRGDLKRARRALSIVCPWIDEYFAGEVSTNAAPSLDARVLMRPEKTVDSAMWPHMVAAVAVLREHFGSLQVRTLERLHAKCIVLDDEIAYVGSTNFYWFSLEQSRELTIRGPLARLGDAADELSRLWDEGKPMVVSGSVLQPPESRVSHEVQDPIVQDILRQNPRAWVVGRRQSRDVRRPKH